MKHFSVPFVLFPAIAFLVAWGCFEYSMPAQNNPHGAFAGSTSKQTTIQRLDYHQMPLLPSPPSQSFLEELLQKALTGDPNARVEYTLWVDIPRLTLNQQHLFAQERIRYIRSKSLSDQNVIGAIRQLGLLWHDLEARIFLTKLASDKTQSAELRRHALSSLSYILAPDDPYNKKRIPPRKEELILIGSFLRSHDEEDRLEAVSAIEQGLIVETTESVFRKCGIIEYETQNLSHRPFQRTI